MTKQLECESNDDFFYKTLEVRQRVKKEVVRYLSENYIETEWARSIIQKLENDELHLFMPFSHQAMLAREQIEKELDYRLVINAIVEQG